MKHEINLRFINCGQYTREYYDIIDLVVEAIRLKYPNYYQSVEPFIEDMKTATFQYSLLEGLVQQGKTIAAIIIIWILTLRYHYHVVFITKNISDVRSDVISKFEKGFLNNLIENVGRTYGLSSGEIDTFKITAESGLDQKSASGPPIRCVVPVFLMQPDNHKAVLNYFKRTLLQQHNSYCVFIIDEIHEMYTDTKEFLQKRGFNQVGDLGNRHLLHKLHELCAKHTCGILGITATPYRAMATDPTCNPTKRYVITPDPPFSDACYYGYCRTNKRLQNITLNIVDVDRSDLIDHVDIIHKILARPRNVMPDGRIEIPFINIVHDRKACEQHILYEMISHEFGHQVYCRLCIAKQTARTNNIALDCVAETLSDFFNSNNLTQQICQGGALILIGNSRQGASITIKPALQSKCEMNVAGSTYYIEGITDFIANVSDTLETQMQRNRHFGWYLRGHKCYHWLPKKYAFDTQQGMMETSSGFCEQYDPSIGPASVYHINSSMTTIHHICGSYCPYELTNGRRSIYHYTTTSPPSNGVELETVIHKPAMNPHLWSDVNIHEVPLSDKKGRELLRSHLIGGSGCLQAFQMPWPQKK